MSILNLLTREDEPRKDKAGDEEEEEELDMAHFGREARSREEADEGADCNGVMNDRLA